MDQFIFSLIGFCISLVGSAFFSSSETAFTAVNRIKLRHLVEKMPKRKKLIERIYKKPKRLLTGILIGNNISNVAASALATALLLHWLKQLGFENFGTNMTIITFTVTFLLLIFGEITPKTIAMKIPERLSIFYARPILFFLLIFTPVIALFETFTSLFYKIIGLKDSEKNLLTLDEMKTMVNVGREEGLIEKEKEEMLHSIFEFSDMVVREVMTPRTDTLTVNVDAEVRDVMNLIIEKGHSRIPVYEDKIDNIVGVIYAKDLLSVSNDDQTQSIRKFLREAIFIPESKGIELVLQQMKRNKFHLAIVVDEYGGMAGIVTLEDIIEEIIGDIQDEYDQEMHAFQLISNGKYLVDARMSLKELSEKLDLSIPENDDYDTVGGFVLSLFGKFPIKGEEITFNNLLFQVKDVKKRRIISIIIQKIPTPPNQ